MSNTYVGDLLLALTGFGSRDLAQATEWLDRAELDYSEFAAFGTSYCNDTGMTLQDLDIVALVLEFAAQEAGAGELRESIHSNYLCSTYDLNAEEASEILYDIDKDERGAAWRFLVEMTDAVEPSVEDVEEVADAI